MRSQALRLLPLSLMFLASAALAQQADDRYLTILGSHVSPDSARNLEDGIGGRVLSGIPLGEATNLELNLSGYSADAETGGGSLSAVGIGGDLMFPMSGQSLRPFFLIGAGYQDEDFGGGSEGAAYGNAGLGLLAKLSERWSLRAEGRYVHLFDAPGIAGESQLDDVHLSLGLQLALSAPPPPVIAAPAPAPAAQPEPVLAAPAPAAPVDADRDGVVDAADRCPGTQPGVRVNTFGCALDADGDKVADAQDSCPNTPAGVQVTVSGCPLDHDGDKVADYLDKCPNTLAGLTVDERGCVIETKAQTVVLQNVNFKTGKSELTAEAKQVLDQIAVGLSSQSSLKVEIAGHTDSVGAAAMNKKLSQSRADAVRAYLIGKGVAPAQLNSKGYGPDKPVADNKTPSGRAQNRRVEFRVLAQ